MRRARDPDAVSDPNAAARGRAIRAGIAVGVATATYGISFGALATASGLDILQTCFLSLVMFSGGSQFALIGVLATGGVASGGAAIASATLLGLRNMFYSVRMSPVVGPGLVASRGRGQLDRSTSRRRSRSANRPSDCSGSDSGSPASRCSSAGIWRP